MGKRLVGCGISNMRLVALVQWLERLVWCGGVVVVDGRVAGGKRRVGWL